MKKVVLILIGLTGLLVVSCDQSTGEKVFQPDPVRLVLRPAGADTLSSEPGIDAVPTAENEINKIQIQWYRHEQVKNLQKFLVYRSDDPEGRKNYQVVGEVPANIIGEVDSIFFDTQDLQYNVRYYYYVTAIGDNGKESLPSDTVSYKLLEKAIKLSLNGNSNVVSQTVMEFEWWIQSGNTPDRYILRIERFVNNDYHPLAYVKVIQSNYQTPQTFRLEGEVLKTLFPNGDYRWRIDCVGREDIVNQYFEGSESSWQLFKIKWAN